MVMMSTIDNADALLPLFVNNEILASASHMQHESRLSHFTRSPRALDPIAIKANLGAHNVQRVQRACSSDYPALACKAL
jgi:hypothetical protein